MFVLFKPEIRFAVAPEGVPADGSTSVAPKPVPAASDYPEGLGDPGKRALDIERAARNTAETERAALQAQLDAIAAEKLTDVERAQAEATAEREAKAVTDAENLRLRVALNNAVPAALVGRLVGNTEAELVADWETNVKPLIGAVAPTPGVDQYLGHPSHQKTSSRDLGSAEADRRFGATN